MDTRAALNLVFSLHIWRESQHKNNEKFTFLNTILRKFIPFKVSQDIDQAFISAILVAVTTPAGSSQYSENYLEKAEKNLLQCWFVGIYILSFDSSTPS